MQTHVWGHNQYAYNKSNTQYSNAIFSPLSGHSTAGCEGCLLLPMGSVTAKLCHGSRSQRCARLLLWWVTQNTKLSKNLASKSGAIRRARYSSWWMTNRMMTQQQEEDAAHHNTNYVGTLIFTLGQERKSVGLKRKRRKKEKGQRTG